MTTSTPHVVDESLRRHLIALLKAGKVKQFNRSRPTHETKVGDDGDVLSDVRTASGRRTVFDDLDLDGEDFSGLDFRCVNLSRARLRGTNFSGANLQRALFVRCDLGCVDFSGADLSGASFFWCELAGANLSGAKVSCAHFYGCGNLPSKKARELTWAICGDDQRRLGDLYSKGQFYWEG